MRHLKVTRKDSEDKRKCAKNFLGLLVDIQKTGFVNTNDGNTSRRFFGDTDKSSAISRTDSDSAI